MKENEERRVEVGRGEERRGGQRRGDKQFRTQFKLQNQNGN